jgi:hypothetical protein
MHARPLREPSYRRASVFEGGYQERRVVAVGGVGHCSYGDARSVHRRGAFDAPFAPVHRASARHFPSTRGFGYAAVHGHLRKVQANESVVSFEYCFPQRVEHSQFDPLVAPIPKRGGRAPLVGDPVVGAAEHQDLHTSFSKTTRSGMRRRWHPSGWFISLSGSRAANCCQMGSMRYGGSAGTDRLLRWEASRTPQMIEQPVSAFQVDVLRPYPRKLLSEFSEVRY